MRQGEHDLLLIYQIAKLLDASHSGSGLIKTFALFALGEWCFGWKDRRLEQRIKDGDGKYWRLGDDRSGLVSPKRVVSGLGPTMPSSKPLSILTSSIRDYTLGACPLANLQRLWICIAAARGGRDRPCSIAALSQEFGVSERTVQRALRSCDALSVTSNFRIRHIASNKKECQEEMDKLELGYPRALIRQHLGEFWLIEQIPNSYEFLLGEWLPYRNRLLVLKNYTSNASTPQSNEDRYLRYLGESSAFWM